MISRMWRIRKQRLDLVGEVCPHCDHKIFPPRDVCPNCGDEAEEQFTFPEPPKERGRNPSEVLEKVSS